MASETQTIAVAENPRKRNWWKFGDGAVLLAYSSVVLWTLQYHEKWADEAQAWLIARDLDLRTIWFHELRYEGSPGLWHTILWVAQHVFHAGYGAIGYVGAVFAIAGAAVLVFCAPFPRYIRWPLVFTYVMVYQYAVIARPYTLLPVLAFCAAIVFNEQLHPEKITIVCVGLAMLTLHGAILAGCLAFTYALEAIPRWREFERTLRLRYFGCAGILACAFAFLVLILRPTADVEEFALKQDLAQLPETLRALQPTWETKLVSIVTGAFVDSIVPSVVLVLVLAAFCAWRRKFLVYAMPLICLVGLYVGVHGYSHHHGAVTIAAITALWIAWPTRSEMPNLQNRFVLTGMAICLLLFCAVNVLDAAVVIKHEYLYPYSGAKDAANFLKQSSAEQGGVFGLLYGVVGIQPYFDHNIFANVHTSYFHHGTPLEGATLDADDIQKFRPEYIVAFTEQPQLMADLGTLNQFAALGYRVAHFSDGYLLYKRGVYVRQSYFILRRVHEGDAENASPRSLR